MTVKTLDDIPDILVAEGPFKFIVADVTIGGATKRVIRVGNGAAHTHSHIFHDLQMEVYTDHDDRGIDVLGGGILSFLGETVYVCGKAFGDRKEPDRAATIAAIAAELPDYDVRELPE